MKNLLCRLFCGAWALLLLLPACQQPAKGEGSEAGSADPRLDYLIVPGERVGLITPEGASKEAILAAYGDLAKADSVYLYEGISDMGLVLFPDDARNRVDLYWDPASNGEQPDFIRIWGEKGSTDWATSQGITIGSTLAEVEAANGKPFELFGFDWDYGGYLTDWKGGAMGNHLGLRFAPPEGAQLPSGMSGEVTLKSDDEALRAVNPVVVEMSFSFPSIDQLPALQGRWQSTTNPGYQIVFEGDKLRHYNEGKLTYESTIEADPDCQSSPCQVTGQIPTGFCFLEKGEYDVQCNLLLSAQDGRLAYTAIGAAGGSLVFERLE